MAALVLVAVSLQVVEFPLVVKAFLAVAVCLISPNLAAPLPPPLKPDVPNAIGVRYGRLPLKAKSKFHADRMQVEICRLNILMPRKPASEWLGGGNQVYRDLGGGAG